MEDIRVAAYQRVLTDDIVGINLDENTEKFMFYPFITSKADAEGLGLTFVNSIISSFGGHFKYEREKNLSSFNLFFPIGKNRR